jgi:hypothetical protein
MDRVAQAASVRREHSNPTPHFLTTSPLDRAVVPSLSCFADIAAKVSMRAGSTVSAGVARSSGVKVWLRDRENGWLTAEEFSSKSPDRSRHSEEHFHQKPFKAVGWLCAREYFSEYR